MVSIIIPCYNQEQFIAETLDSVCSQTYQDWEAIVIDDGSTDKSSEIVKRYAERDKRIKYLYQDNSGPSVARNRGGQVAKGQLLAFLDSDDIIDPSFLEIGVGHLLSDEECKVWYAGVEFFGGKKGEFKVKYSNYRNLLLGNSIVLCCIIRKKDFERIQGFDESLFGYEDWEFFIRLLHDGGSVCKDDRLLFHYRMGVNMDSVSKQAKRNRSCLDDYVYDKNLDFYKEEFGSPIKILREREQLQSEVTWYRDMLSHPLIKIAFSIQIRINNIKNLLKK